MKNPKISKKLEIIISLLFVPIFILLHISGEYESIRMTLSFILVIFNLSLLIALIKKNIHIQGREKLFSILRLLFFNIIILFLCVDISIRRQEVCAEFCGVHEVFTTLIVGAVQLSFLVLYSAALFVIPLFNRYRKTSSSK